VPTTDETLPDLNADGVIPGLAGVVEVRRDPYGVPHIRATSQDDAFAALGFVHAQDRLWQMEALLRRGTGHYAEWVGRPALAGDELARRLDTEGASKRDLAALNAETRAMLEAYARGVNAFIALKRWPVEYALLKTSPRAWEPWHSIAVMRQIGFLMGSVWWKLWRSAALPIIGADKVDMLRFDDGGNDFLCMPPGAEIARANAAMADLRPGVEALLASGAIDATAGGSNNWAIAPSRTAAGRPLLAGDPHRVLEMPSMYAQIHLACDAFDVVGLTVPGVPGFPHFGHNRTLAWCVTHAFMDIHDLFVERFDAEGARTRFKDEWRPVTTRVEVIKVRGEADVAITAVETCHGPVIVGDPKSGHALALRSTQFALEDHSFDCLLPQMRAATVAELYASTRGWGLIDHNLVAGDVSGAIGHRVRAIVPRRPRANGWLPVPGWTGEHEWDGIVPFEAMPQCVDPDAGMIVTANNRVIAEGEHYLSTDCMPPHRARRVWARLQALDRAEAADMAPIHRDIVSIPGLELKDRLQRVPAEGAAARLRETILAWDGAMDGASRGAVAYAALRNALTRLAFEKSGLHGAAASAFAKVPPGIYPEGQFWWTLPRLLRDDDARLLGGATWDELLAAALIVAEVPEGTWAQIHAPKLTHPLSATFPEHAAMLDRASAPVNGDNDTVFATGYATRFGYRALYSGLARYVFDVGTWDKCQWIVFHGASGHPSSPWHLNQNAAWARGEMVPMLYDWAAIESTAVAQQRLTG
jgi:penicillin amidase